MGYEIDFMPVGDGERGGDAIALRYGNLHGSRNEQTVIIIDGGNKDSGQKLVEFLDERYGTDVVDLVVCTHPDSDHSSGLSVVLEQLDVKRLWMHRPWKHAGKISDAFVDGDITNDDLSELLQESLTHARTLEQLAIAKGIPISEPFSDDTSSTRFPEITVLGPSREYYRELLPEFGDMPLTKSVSGVFVRLTESIKAVAENWNWETLAEPVEGTRAENNSSAILLLQVDGRNLLFTGDAGVPALGQAADFACDEGVDLKSCVFQQIPHHGSKRNVGPSILNRIVGPIGMTNGSKTVFVSVPKEGEPKHPAKKVTNAYARRGANVVATKGNAICHNHEGAGRWGYGPATPVPFYNEVED